MLRTAILGLMLVLTSLPVGAADRLESYRIGGGNSRLDLLGGALQFGIPTPVALNTEELVIDVPFRVKSVGVSGRIESISFSNLAINGIPFVVDPYHASFDLPDEDEPIVFPAPLRLRVRFIDVAPGVVREALAPSETLRLTGNVTVSGEYRKWIFSMRRAVEIPIDVTGPNPIAEYHPIKLLGELPTREVLQSLKPNINLRRLRLPEWPF